MVFCIFFTYTACLVIMTKAPDNICISSFLAKVVFYKVCATKKFSKPSLVSLSMLLLFCEKSSHLFHGNLLTKDWTSHIIQL